MSQRDTYPGCSLSRRGQAAPALQTRLQWHKDFTNGPSWEEIRCWSSAPISTP